MTDTHDKRLRKDLAGLVRTMIKYGSRSEELKTYILDTSQQYAAQGEREEYQSLGAVLILGFEKGRQEGMFSGDLDKV
ncbi:hypothetical protein HYS49_01360 [Candidatus Woesearchaeota archaeon]|nr:hypothetical protein [Candidatus Woesearchaeota archaeon]